MKPATPKTAGQGNNLDPDTWELFCTEIRSANRFHLSGELADFIDQVVASAARRVRVIEEGEIAWRTRKGCRPSQDGPRPYVDDDIGAPPPELAVAGRANPEGVPYLYLASDYVTAIAEVRPWIEEQVSVGRFDALQDVRVVDATGGLFRGITVTIKTPSSTRPGEYDKEYAADEDGNGFVTQTAEEKLWRSIDDAFSQPVSPPPSDNPSIYAPTQYLAERLKGEGYQGVAYKSALSSSGINYVVFEPNLFRFKCSKIMWAKEITYKIADKKNGHAFYKSEVYDDPCLYLEVD